MEDKPTMKVKELIERLQHMQPDAEVWVSLIGSRGSTAPIVDMGSITETLDLLQGPTECVMLWRETA